MNSVHRLVPRLARLIAVTIGVGSFAHAQVAIVSSYSQSFNSLGSALPAGWAVWTDSTTTGNGNAFAWSTSAVANNATASATTYFRNVPGASQSWSAGLSAGADRALGWRAGSSGSRDGSITFTLSNTTGWTFTSLSFQVFTPNSAGTVATFQFQYQLGTSGTFTNFSPAVSYTTDVAQSPLIVTSITLTAAQLAPLANQSGQVTLRFDNVATSSFAFNTFALDNFSYSASASAVPEPSTYAGLIGVTALGCAAWRRRRQISPRAW